MHFSAAISTTFCLLLATTNVQGRATPRSGDISRASSTLVGASSADLKTFKLDPSFPTSAELGKKLGPIQYPGAGPGANDVPAQVGWPQKKAEVLDGFIQNNQAQGVLFYAKNTALTLYLNATKNDGFWPKYTVVLGNPDLETDQTGVLSTNWTTTISSGATHLGYNGDTDFLACGNSTHRFLFSGGIDPNGPTPRRCKKVVLTVAYDA